MGADPATTITDAVNDAVNKARAAGNGLAVAAALNCVRPDDLAVYFHNTLRAAGGDARDGVGVDGGDRGDGAVPAPLAEGLPASPGAAAGAIMVDAAQAVEAVDQGLSVILVRSETTPDDVLGMQAAAGILTARGGLVSHAAVVARGWGIPAVVGAADVVITGDAVTIGTARFQVGDEITIDGTSGRIYRGLLDTTEAEPPPALATLLAWADSVAEGHVQVRANADTRGDAGHGRELGAKGIGLCRTEHMFLAADRLDLMRRFILADDPDTEAAALAGLEEVQQRDFEELLEAMDGLPVTVRLLDPPLHEFLPDLADLTAREARGELDPTEHVELAAVRRLSETNPMIGTRGVRLAMVRSGLYEMQVRALCRAAAGLLDQGLDPRVEIMIPLVVDAEELRIARSWVAEVLDDIGRPELSSTTVTVGAMIETPRAALTAAALAEHADFFSFGTNDLTQMTYAFSRDDVEARLLPAYQRLGLLAANPFAVLDQEGVGELVRIASEAARSTDPTIKLGVCGEHAGHPASADFLVRLGVDSVSCSPFRVPMARLAVAQALLACGRVQIDDVEFNYADAGVADAGSSTADPDSPTRSDQAGVDAGPPANDDPQGPPLDIDEALVLHVLRIRGFVSADGLAESLGRHTSELLDELGSSGLVNHMEGRNLYSLLPPGRERQEALLAERVDDELRTGLAASYGQFLALNTEFKELCNRWQVRDGEPNDHTDPSYDQDRIAELVDLNGRLRPILTAMAAVLPRLSRYIHRLHTAAACVGDGLTNRFTGVMCESYHDIWMELHEDLIVLQGIDRSAEGSY